MFTDVLTGTSREADVVARVSTLADDPEIIAVHVEVEARRRGEFAERMNDYYRVLRLRYGIPILPIAIYLSPGAGGITVERYVERVFSREVNVFTYNVVDLPDLSAEEYLDTDNPLAPALSALMDAGSIGRVALKYRSLVALAGSQVDDARRAILATVVERYLILDSEEETALSGLLEVTGAEEVSQMISPYEERGIVIGKRRTLLRQMKVKYGELPGDIRTYVEATASEDELDRLTDAIVFAPTLDDLALPVSR